MFDFEDASPGAHHELQVSLFVSRGPLAPLPAHRLTVIEQMVVRDDVHMLCHGLWNSTPRVVAYNRELLALDARLSESRIEFDRRPGTIDFAVHDAATRTPVVEGHLERVQRPSLRANLALVARLGLWRLAAIARQPWLRVPVLNPVGERLPRNAAADSFTKADRSVLRLFDPERDRLAFGDRRYRALDFRPQLVQFMEGFKFVYLAPA
ncbi:hypothetical protein [Piscinibacter defluvii]|uniref:hypothetical protein n=1 Tax=Piscinibacter defluvii TaxID=1796922 RepID=UPI000FDF5B56|nr:hypothetical protein [Piscinibacter defluvii]